MAKQRIYELARTLGLKSKEVLTRAQELGIAARTASSGLEEDEAALVTLSFEEGSVATEAVAAEPAEETAPVEEPSPAAEPSGEGRKGVAAARAGWASLGVESLVSDLAGLDVPSGVQGTSLRPILANPAAEVKMGALSFHHGTALRAADWAYMRYNDGTEELYDMQSDPKQFHNLAAIAEYQGQLTKMRARMAARLAALE